MRRTDVADRSDIDALAIEAAAALPSLAVWVNAAGILITAPIVDALPADTERLIAIT